MVASGIAHSRAERSWIWSKCAPERCFVWIRNCAVLESYIAFSFSLRKQTDRHYSCAQRELARPPAIGLRAGKLMPQRTRYASSFFLNQIFQVHGNENGIYIYSIIPSRTKIEQRRRWWRLQFTCTIHGTFLYSFSQCHPFVSEARESC